MVIVFDDSLSMLFSLLESPASIQRFIDSQYSSDADFDYMRREPNRISTAKKSAAAIIDKIDPNIDIGLVSLKVCPGARNHGMFGPGKAERPLKARNQCIATERQ